MQIPSFIIDAHQDISWNALELGRDPLHSAFSIRKQEASSGVDRIFGGRTTGLPEYLTGRIGIIFATLYVTPAKQAKPGYNKVTYSTPRQAEAWAMQQIDYYHRLIEAEPRLRLIRSSTDLEEVVASWQQPGQQPLVGLVILMEGADPIVNPSELPRWYEAGLRMIGPAWRSTRYSGGTGEPGPLTDLGYALLDAMADLNLVVDLSHMAESAFFQAIERYPGLLIASHSNPRRFLPTDRGLSDEMIIELVARDGVVGIVPYNRFLKPGWVKGDPREQVTLETVAAAIDHIAQLVGDAQHVAIGSDFDGGFGLDSIPYGMDSIADLIKLADVLRDWGYSDDDVESIMNGNWLRILRATLP